MKIIFLLVSIIAGLVIGLISAFILIVVALALQGDAPHASTNGSIIEITLHFIFSILTILPFSFVVNKYFGNKKLAIGALIVWPVLNIAIYPLSAFIFFR